MKDLIRDLQAVGLNPVVIDENTEFLDMGVSNPEFVENSNGVPSPFIPGTFMQFAWDSTSLGYLKTCPRLYQYIVIDGWQPREDSVHLRFGQEYHQAIADYKKSRADNISHEDALFDVIKALMFRINDWWPDHKYKNRIHLLYAIVGYIDSHQDDPAATIILNNGEPAVEHSFRFETQYMCTDTQPYILCGHLDDVVKFNNNNFPMDRKTTTSTPGSYYWQQFEPNNQMTIYTMAAGVVLEEPANGVIIDSCQLLLEHPYVRFTRGITYRTQDQLEEWIYDLSFVLAEAEEYARKEYWPMRDTSCNMFGGCKFREVCAAARHIRPAILESDFIKGEPWNPLKPR